MPDIHALAPSLQQSADGIWYSPQEVATSYPADGNSDCFAVEDGSFWFKHRNTCIAEVASAFPPADNGAIFDIGGGNGFVSKGLINAGFTVVLVEPGRTGVTNAKKRGITNVICATSQTAGFREKSLSAAGLFDVLEHIEDEQAFLRSIHALLKDAAPLYLTVPAYNFLWSHEDVAAGHFRRYTLKQLTAVLKSAGFELLYASYIFRFLPLPIFMLRAIPWHLGLAKPTHDSDKTKQEHAAPNGSAVHILNRLLSAEIANIRNQKTMHCGGSCLMVARKSTPAIHQLP